MDKVYSSAEALEWFKKNYKGSNEQVTVLCVDVRSEQKLLVHKYSEAQEFFDRPFKKPTQDWKFKLINTVQIGIVVIAGLLIIWGVIYIFHHRYDNNERPDAFHECAQLGDCTGSGQN